MTSTIWEHCRRLQQSLLRIIIKQNSIRHLTAYLEKLDALRRRRLFFALMKSKCMPLLLYGTEACPVNSAVRHSLQFALNRALFKIFGALSKDTYQDICKYFGIWTVEEQMSNTLQIEVVVNVWYSTLLCS